MLVENIKCQVLEIFDNSYIAFTVQQLEVFIKFILTRRENLGLLNSFHSSFSENFKNSFSSSVPQTSVLKTTKPQSLDGLRTDDLVIPTQSYSDVLVAPIDDNTLGNELTVDPFMDKEEIIGEFLISVEEWNGISIMQENSNFRTIGPTYLVQKWKYFCMCTLF